MLSIRSRVAYAVGALSLVLSVTFFGLWQHSSNELELLQQKYASLQIQLKDCSESKDKLIQSQAKTETIIDTNQSKIQIIEDKEDSYQQELNQIAAQDCLNTVKADETKPKQNVARLSDELPDNLISLLDKVHNSNQRSSSSSSR